MIILNLTWYTDTIYLNASGCRVVGKWYPKTGRDDEETVVEEITLQFAGTKATARTFKQKLEQWMKMAQQNKELQTKDRGIYLNFAPDDTETAWRSLVLDGMVSLTEKMMNTWKDGKIELRLVVERANWWEGAQETLPLTNGNGTDSTTGNNVYTCSADGTGSSPNVRDDWVKIKAADVDGDLPAPTQINMLVPTSPTFIAFNKIWMGLYKDRMSQGSDPGENIETFLDTDAGATSNADASGGTYYAITLGTSATVEARFNITPSSTYMKSSWMRFFLRTYQPAPDGTWVRLRAVDKALGFLIGTTPWVQIESTGEAAGNTRIYDLGLMRYLPMEFLNTANFIALFEVEMWNAGGGTLNLDAINFFGVDEYRELGRGNRSDGIGYTTTGGTPTEVLIRDGCGSFEPYSYVRRIFTGPTTYDVQFFTELIGEGIWLTPGIDQYLHIATRSPQEYFDNDVDMYVTVYIYYRPRRRNL